MDRVSDVMSHQIVTISEAERLSTVEDIMTLGGVRHMPVVNSGRLVGVVSERDLLRASISTLEESGTDDRRAFLNAVEIASVMSHPPIVVGPRASVSQAARLMADHKIGCLPVIDDAEALIGMITETDVLLYFAGQPAPIELVDLGVDSP